MYSKLLPKLLVNVWFPVGFVKGKNVIKKSMQTNT